MLLFRKSKLPHTKAAFIAAMRIELQDAIWDASPIVVEEYLDIDQQVLGGSPSVEFFVDLTGEVHPTYAGEQILADDRKTFAGFYVYP